MEKKKGNNMTIELAAPPAGRSITAQRIQDAIKCKEFHLFQGTTHMVCCLTLQCGFTVTGESACADPNQFDLQLGQHYAQEDAERKIGELLAYEQSKKLAFGGQYGH